MLCLGKWKALHKQEDKAPSPVIFFILTHSSRVRERSRAAWRCGGRPRKARGGRGPAASPRPRRARSCRRPGYPTLSGAEKRREGAGSGDLLHPRAETGGMFPVQEEADRTVFVGNLEARVREEILYELFLQVSSAGGGGGAGSGGLAGSGGQAGSVEPEAQPEGRGAPGPPGARPPSRRILCLGV